MANQAEAEEGMMEQELLKQQLLKQQQQQRWVQRAAKAALWVSGFLVVIKLYAWYLSGSAGVLSSLLDSAMDIAASLMNFFAIRYALMPADKAHPFGHSKAESLAAMMQAMFITLSALTLLVHVFQRIADPQTIQAIPTSLGIFSLSIVLTIGLVIFQRWVVKKTGSIAIKADSTHYYSDILSNGVIVVALMAAQVGVFWLDAYVALGVVLLLLYGVYEILNDALPILLDEAMAEEKETAIKQLIISVDGVKGVHDFKSRQSSRQQFIQFHLELNGQQTLKEAHGIGDTVEHKIVQQFPHADVLIHHDPV